jgi:hypothetical protein
MEITSLKILVFKEGTVASPPLGCRAQFFPAAPDASSSHRRTISPFCVLDLGKFHMPDAITAAKWPFARAIGSFLEFEKYPRPGLAIFFYLRTHEC